MSTINTSDNRYFINNMPIGERDCEDGGMEGMEIGPSAKELALRAESARKAKVYNASASALNSRRCKEVEARQLAMRTKLGRALKNSEMDVIRWQVSKEIK